MITARRVGRPSYLEMIEEIDRELTKVIEDFMRAVDVEALRLAKKSSKYLNVLIWRLRILNDFV